MQIFQAQQMLRDEAEYIRDIALCLRDVLVACLGVTVNVRRMNVKPRYIRKPGDQVHCYVKKVR